VLGYRLYFIDDQDVFFRFDDFLAEDDVTAFEIAERLRTGSAGQLWQGKRLVGSFARAETAMDGDE
jgi:hypothetical protein